MIIFMDDDICMTTGGDMKDAYAALCEVPRIWFIISCKKLKCRLLPYDHLIFNKCKWNDCFIKLLRYHYPIIQFLIMLIML